jgi:insulysin
MCGNKKTLEVEGMRNHLLEFHKTWYSANIMHLCILSNHSIADMQKWVQEKFSEIKNFNVEVPNLGDPAPFPAG